MYTTKLIHADGGTLITLSPDLLELLNRKNGATVVLIRDGDQITIESCRPRYTVEELLAECDPDAPITEEEREWLDAPRVGRELI